MKQQTYMKEKSLCPICGAELTDRNYRILKGITGLSVTDLKNGGMKQVTSSLLVGMTVLEKTGIKVSAEEGARNIIDSTIKKLREVMQPEIEKDKITGIKEQIRRENSGKEELLREKEREIAELKKEIRELNKRYVETSKQIDEKLSKLVHNPLAKGKMQEFQIATTLKTISPTDNFETGQSTREGEDVLAMIREEDTEKGRIAIESKNVKRWNRNFVEKFKSYMRKENTPYGIIATTILPDDKLNEKMYTVTEDGIWIVRIDYLEIAYRAMRDFILKIREIEIKSKQKISDFSKVMQKFREISNSKEYEEKFKDIGGRANELREISDKLFNYCERHCKTLKEIADNLIEDMNSVISFKENLFVIENLDEAD